MKIAIVHPRLDIKGGAENVIVWLAEGLLQRKHDVTIFTKFFSDKLWHEHRNARGIMNALRGADVSKSLERIFLGWRLKKLLVDYDVVVSSLFPSHVWVACARALGCDLPKTVWLCHEPHRQLYREETDSHVVTYRDHIDGTAFWNKDLVAESKEYRMSRASWKIKRNRRWDKQAVSQVDMILAFSRFTREKAKNIYGIEPTLCYPGIPHRHSEKRKTADDEGYIITIGYSSPKKNLSAVLEAFRILVHDEGCKNIALKVTGNSSVKEKYLPYVARFGIQRNVTFTGFVSDGELAALYENALATVYVPIDEPFGLVALESLIQGTPVVVSQHGGMSEVVKDGEMGFLVDPLNPISIATAISRLLHNSHRAAEMGMNGRTHVLQDFTLEKFVRRFEETALREKL